MGVPAVLKGTITEKVWDEAVYTHRVEKESYDGTEFYRARKNLSGLPWGTVLNEDELVAGFPRIYRVLHLENGIRRNIKTPFYVEEKVDGYNTRIALFSGKVLAFTRGGFVCPFATDRAPDFFDGERFFSENPGMVVCGEVAGPESPYTTESPPYLKEDVSFFAFEIMEKGSGMLFPPEERHEVLERYGIPQVRSFGRFDPGDISGVRDAIECLDRDGCEGIVIKPLKGRMHKYVTAASTLIDIRGASELMAEMPSGFFTQRVMRRAFCGEEFHLPVSPGETERIGDALLSPLVKVLKGVVMGGDVSHAYQVKVREEATVDKLLRHLNYNPDEVTVELISKREICGYWVARFRRHYPKATAELKRLWEGVPFLD